MDQWMPPKAIVLTTCSITLASVKLCFKHTTLKRAPQQGKSPGPPGDLQLPDWTATP